MSHSIARERIAILFDEANDALDDDEYERSRRYLSRASEIATHHAVSFTRNQRMRFCDECSVLLQPGKTARVRLSGKNIVITCHECGTVSRFGYSD